MCVIAVNTVALQLNETHYMIDSYNVIVSPHLLLWSLHLTTTERALAPRPDWEQMLSF